MNALLWFYPGDDVAFTALNALAQATAVILLAMLLCTIGGRAAGGVEAWGVPGGADLRAALAADGGGGGADGAVAHPRARARAAIDYSQIPTLGGFGIAGAVEQAETNSTEASKSDNVADKSQPTITAVEPVESEALPLSPTNRLRVACVIGFGVWTAGALILAMRLTIGCRVAWSLRRRTASAVRAGWRRR